MLLADCADVANRHRPDAGGILRNDQQKLNATALNGSLP
jgi:hypothetical protein